MNPDQADAIYDRMRDDKAEEQFIKTPTHELLLMSGWKVKALPDNINTQEITIYSKGNEEIVLYQDAIATMIAHPKKIDPKTGTVTTEEAKKLLFEITRAN